MMGMYGDLGFAQGTDIESHIPLLQSLVMDTEGDVLEIGVRDGISTRAILQALDQRREGHLYSIDIEDCSRVAPENTRWTFIRGDSHDDGERLMQIPSQFGLLLVDGDHSYEGCLLDLIVYGQMAKVIAVHDTDCPETFPGVRKAVHEYFRQSKRDVLRFHHGSYGMAVIE